MKLDKHDIENMRRNGVKVSPKDKTDVDYLKSIERELKELNGKSFETNVTVPKIEVPKVTVQAPEVNVNVPAPKVTVESPKQPEVKVNVPPVKQVKEWEFNLTRNMHGQVEKIIAKAIE